MAKEKSEEFAMELEIYQPEVNSGKVIVNGNFEELQSKVIALVEKYKNTELTEDNVNYVMALKSNFVSMRTAVEEKRKNYNDIYITPMKKYVDGMCKDLIAKIQEGEDALKQQLEEYDQKRKDELSLVLQDYVNDSASRHNLREEYKAQIQLLPKYFNKTQKEEDSADDIERQAVELEKKQTETDSAVELIKSECEGTVLIVENYIKELDYKSPMEIILEIKTDKKKSEQLLADMKAKEQSGEKVVIGEKAPASMSFNDLDAVSETKESVRVRTIQLSYKDSQAELVKSLFAKLKAEGITYKFI